MISHPSPEEAIGKGGKFMSDQICDRILKNFQSHRGIFWSFYCSSLYRLQPVS